MSDHIPFELQVEVIKRVPVKSLLRFRSVSKQWKSVIDSPDFGDDYCLRQSQPHRLLIRYLSKDEHFSGLIHNGPVNHISRYKYVLVDDNDTLQQHQFPLPQSVKNLRNLTIVGCSHGLVCFYGDGIDQPFPCDYRDGSHTVVLCNPWIRKCVDIPVPNVLFGLYETILGFGVSPQTKDPKIVKINSFRSFDSGIDTSVPIPWRVEVFTLSSGTWKSPPCSGNNLPCRDSIMFRWSQVALDGVIYWLAFETIKVDGRFRNRNLIMSFDLSSEGFEEICLPDNLARPDEYNLLIISKRLQSVVVLEKFAARTSFSVWMMGQGVTKSFTKIFNVNVMIQEPHYFKVYGFMKNGEPIIAHRSDALFAYDPYSERIKDLGIVRPRFVISVKSYMETLLLIDR